VEKGESVGGEVGMRETWDGIVGATSRKKLCPLCGKNEIYVSEWICEDCYKEGRYLLVSE